ncbi:MAG TPA: DUF1772 domain-containing protein [Rhizomicrobium sp.]|jgi:hypothetical protein|nr:DUF1772 domain-containing protein [Rhizomicrobium sp.]
MYRVFRSANLIIAFVATTAPMAHVLELISKMTLDGPHWLAIQQTLYRGWGAVFGPVEILALLTSAALFFLTREQGARRAFAIAAGCYAVMLVCFFVFNGPVNDALNGWTARSLPPDWSDYRLRWETGHALAAFFSIVAFVALLRSRIRLGARG